MESFNVQSFIDSLVYDFDTVRYLQAYGRLKETLPIIKRIILRIQTFREYADEAQGNNFNDIFLPTFWDQNFSKAIKRQDVRQKIMGFSNHEDAVLDKDLENIEYVLFVGNLRVWAYQNISKLKQSIKSPQQKNMEFTLAILSGVVIALCLLLLIIVSYCCQDWGLSDDVYDGRNFEKFVCSGKSKTINFNYYLEMNPHIPHEENFSVRWQGFLMVPKDGNYVLSFIVDDGARLFIDGNPVIDAWYDNNSVEFDKKIFLTKGLHPIRLDYYNHLFGVVLRLFWTPEGGEKKIIPSYYLRQGIGG